MLKGAAPSMEVTQKVVMLLWAGLVQKKIRVLMVMEILRLFL